jgi:hypothetical protein
MQGKAANIRPKVVRALPGPGASKSYMHRAALLYRFKSSQWLIFMTSVYFYVILYYNAMESAAPLDCVLLRCC